MGSLRCLTWSDLGGLSKEIQWLLLPWGLSVCEMREGERERERER